MIRSGIETLSAVILLILIILLFLHLLNGTAVDWITSKFQVQPFQPEDVE